MRALDLYAGAGGWDVAAEALGWEVDGVEIMPEAQATRAAAGLKTVASDVRDYTPEQGVYDVLIASPPCQTFSMAGGGAGRVALDAVLSVVSRFARGERPGFDEIAALTGDERTALVLEPLRVALTTRPMYVAWEQVPPVLPVWAACAHVLRSAGYSVVTGNLNAEQYGVPQTRKRAFLLARRDGRAASLPVPTHSRYYPRDPGKFDRDVQPWVSMAEALGWADTDGLVGFARRADRPDSVNIGGVDYRTRDLRPSGYPAQVVTEKARSWEVFRRNSGNRWALRMGNQKNATTRATNQPAGALHFGARVNAVDWVLRSANERPNTTYRAADKPAPTIASGHSTGERQWLENGVERCRLSLEEAAALQTFPDGFPWQGSMSKQFLQIGNAVPPVLALAALTALTDER